MLHCYHIQVTSFFLNITLSRRLLEHLCKKTVGALIRAGELIMVNTVFDYMVIQAYDYI